MTFQELKAEGHELDLVCDLFEGLWGVSHAVVQSFELDSALCQLYRQRREAGTASNHAEYDLCPRHFVGRKGGFDDDLGVKVIKVCREKQFEQLSLIPLLQLCSST